MMFDPSSMHVRALRSFFIGYEQPGRITPLQSAVDLPCQPSGPLLPPGHPVPNFSGWIRLIPLEVPMNPATALKHVLVVDDNPADIGLIRQVVDGIPGVAIHAAYSVPQAQAFLGRHAPYASMPIPDLILLDLRMPMLPGNTIIPQVRSDPALHHIKIVMFSSSALDRDRTHCERLGADDYILKPCDWIQWRTTITRILTRHGIMPPDDQITS
jgi:CheY-like chemotaxis protein